MTTPEDGLLHETRMLVEDGVVACTSVGAPGTVDHNTGRVMCVWFNATYAVESRITQTAICYLQNSHLSTTFTGEVGISNHTDGIPHPYTEVAKDVLHCIWVFNVD